MLYRSSIGAIALATAMIVGAASAQAHDEKKYPDMRAQWTRIGSAAFDPNKPGGRGQQPPLMPVKKGQAPPDLKYFNQPK